MWWWAGKIVAWSVTVRGHVAEKSMDNHDAEKMAESEVLEGRTTACLLEKAPPVLTVGGRNKFGYSYVWIAAHGPCWILPSGKLLPLKVKREAAMSWK